MKKKKIMIILLISIFIVIAGSLCSFKFFASKVIFKNNNSIEINKEYKLSDFIKKVKNGKLKNGSEKVIFKSLGKKKVKVVYQNKFKKDKKETLILDVVDTIAPEIEVEEEITITVGSKDTLIDDVTIIDNSKEVITPTIEGDYDLNKVGTYELKYVAKDASGNTTKKDFKLIVKDKKTASKAVASTTSTYYVKVNKTLNVAMVYGLDSDNKYTKLVKTFAVSTGGENTPNGVWTTTDRYETLSLVGGVWGHYTIRITGPIWFHSVPYFSKPVDGHWNNLEYEEYNKLGTTASLGCVRLSTIDAKWLYDNLPWHTQVEIYESNTLPDGVVKPAAKNIDVNSENRGWDPTDPDPTNPWNL